MTDPAPLPDGTYDAFVLDATPDPADDSRVSTIDLTIVSGALKGEVVQLSARGVELSDIDLLGMPATLTITDGVPHVQVDD